MKIGKSVLYLFLNLLDNIINYVIMFLYNREVEI